MPDPSALSLRARTELSGHGIAGSQFGNQIVQGVVNVPLGSDAAIRVAGLANLRQGVDRNALDGHYNATDRFGGRGRLLWRPTGDVTINLIGDYSASRFDGAGDFLMFIKAAGPGPFFGGGGFDPVGITARLASCGVTVREGNRDYCTNQSIVGHQYNYGASGEIDYAAGPFTLTSITAYRGSKERGAGVAENVFRADPLELQVQNGNVHRDTDLFTQEFRASSPSDQFLEYTVGAFFSRQTQNREPETLAVILSPAPGLVIPITGSAGARDHIRDESMAVFGQGTFHIAELPPDRRRPLHRVEARARPLQSRPRGQPGAATEQRGRLVPLRRAIQPRPQDDGLCHGLARLQGRADRDPGAAAVAVRRAA